MGLKVLVLSMLFRIFGHASCYNSQKDKIHWFGYFSGTWRAFSSNLSGGTVAGYFYLEVGS